MQEEDFDDPKRDHIKKTKKKFDTISNIGTNKRNKSKGKSKLI